MATSPANVKVLRDATRSAIIDELERLRGKLTDRDNLLIYYAGHGKLRGDSGYWIGIDAARKSRSQWLNYRTVSELLDINNGMRARHVLIVADSCYAGALLRDDNEVSKRQADEEKPFWIQRLRESRSRTALTSGGEGPVIDSAGTSTHSIFAVEFIDRLRTNRGVMDADSLFDSLKADVHERARRAVGSDAQAPGYGRIAGTGHGGGDFLFVPQGMRVKVPAVGVQLRPKIGVRGGPDVGVKSTPRVGVRRPGRLKPPRPTPKATVGVQSVPTVPKVGVQSVPKKPKVGVKAVTKVPKAGKPVSRLTRLRSPAASQRAEIVRRWTTKIKQVEESGPHGDCELSVTTTRREDPADFEECLDRNKQIGEFRNAMQRELEAAIKAAGRVPQQSKR